MKKVKDLFKCLMFSIIMVLGIFGITVYASSATVSISADKTEPEIGESLTVTVTVKADADIGGIETYFLYDEKVLEFQKSGKLISGGDGLLKLSDLDSSNMGGTKKYTIKFKSIGIGPCEVSVNEKAYVYDFEDGNEMSVSTNRLSVNVKGKSTASENAVLGVLKINPGTLSPEFKKDITEYTIDVKGDTKSLVINALAEDSKSTVEISGNSNFLEGENKVIITVKAESGKTKEYIIKVNKKTESQVVETEAPLATNIPDENETIDKFSVEEKDGKTFIKNSYSFEVVDIEDSSLIPSGYLKTKVILYGVSITAYTKVNDLENDFLLIYAMNSLSGEKGFYKYDRIEKTMQRLGEGKTTVSSTDSSNGKDIITSKEYTENLNQLSVIIAVLSSIIALLIIGIIKLFMKVKGIKSDEDFD